MHIPLMVDQLITAIKAPWTVTLAPTNRAMVGRRPMPLHMPVKVGDSAESAIVASGNRACGRNRRSGVHSSSSRGGTSRHGGSSTRNCSNSEDRCWSRSGRGTNAASRSQGRATNPSGWTNMRWFSGVIDERGGGRCDYQGEVRLNMGVESMLVRGSVFAARVETCKGKCKVACTALVWQQS